jgi:hypothetical protein
MRLMCACYVRLLIYEIRYVDDFLQERVNMIPYHMQIPSLHDVFVQCFCRRNISCKYTRSV